MNMKKAIIALGNAITDVIMDASEEAKAFGSLNFAVENDELISRNELNKFIKKHSKVYKKKTA